MAGQRRLAFSTIIVMGSTLGSALLGFVREVINARLYGTHWELDTFLAAAAIPTVLFGVFNGALVSALVPVFAGYLSEGDEALAWSLANTIFNLVFLVLVGCAIVGWMLAPWYVPLIAHGFPAPQLEVTVRMTRWLMPSIITTSLAGVVSAMLNANHRFGSAAFQGIAINLVTIGTVLAFDRQIGIYALTLGTTLGLIAQLFVQLPALLKLGRYRPQIDLQHPGLPRIWAILGPIIIGSAAGQIALCSDRYFASMLPPGSISSMNYAIRIVGVPLQIFAAAIATVIFPLLSGQFTAGNALGISRSMQAALNVMLFAMIPATVLFAVARESVVASLFEGGAFDRSAVDLCAALLPFAAAGLLAQSGTLILSRCCIAGNQSSWTVVASVVSVGANIALSIVLLPVMQARGLLTANAISQWLQMAVIFLSVHIVVSALPLRSLFNQTVRVIVASCIMAAIFAWADASFADRGLTGSARLALTAGKVLLAIGAFGACSAALRVQALSIFADVLKMKPPQIASDGPNVT